jgi:hypothetical protein
MAAPLSMSCPAGVMLLRYRCLEGPPGDGDRGRQR